MPRVRVLAGQERHGTVDRALRFLGLGAGAIVPVDADGQGRMRTEALRSARALGRQGVAGLVERCCGLARRYAGQLATCEGVEVLNQVVLNQVLVRFLAADGGHDAHTRRVVERTQQDGTCWVSGTT